MNRVDFAPGALNPPHLHPRASEIGIVIEGTILAGFVTTNNVYYSKVLTAGQMFVIPRGLVHFQLNVGQGNALSITAFNSHLPGSSKLPLNMFSATPSIPDQVLTKTFQVDQDVISSIRSNAPGCAAHPSISAVHLTRTFDFFKMDGGDGRLRLGTKLVVVITSPSLARQVLKDHDVIFANHDVPVAALATTYGGSDIAWTPYGPEWRILRKVCVLQMLSKTTLDSVHDLRRKQGGGAGLGREFREVISEITKLLAKPNVSDFYPGLARFDLQGLVKQMEGIVKRFDAIFGKVIDTQLRVEKEGDKDEGSKDFTPRRPPLRPRLHLLNPQSDLQGPTNSDDVIHHLLGAYCRWNILFA
ncbi:hypothetical protein ACLB2K_044590 [Fragaria x ananassa]